MGKESSGDFLQTLRQVLKKHGAVQFRRQGKGLGTCLKRIRRELGRLTPETATPALWKPALCRHVAECILRLALDGVGSGEIAERLHHLGAPLPAVEVKTFLTRAARAGAEKYEPALLGNMVRKVQVKPPQGKRGPKSDLRPKLMHYLVWTDDGNRQKLARSWRSWDLREIHFYLLTGIVPPNRYRVTEDLKDRHLFPFDKWTGRVDKEWYERVISEVLRDRKDTDSCADLKEPLNDDPVPRDRKDTDSCAELEELLNDKPLLVNYALREKMYAIPSEDYVRLMLAYYNYHRLKGLFISKWVTRTTPKKSTVKAVQKMSDTTSGSEKRGETRARKSRVLARTGGKRT